MFSPSPSGVLYEFVYCTERFDHGLIWYRRHHGVNSSASGLLQLISEETRVERYFDSVNATALP